MMFGDPFKQAERLPEDGRITLSVDGPDHLLLTVGEETLRMSLSNAPKASA